MNYYQRPVWTISTTAFFIFLYLQPSNRLPIKTDTKLPDCETAMDKIINAIQLSVPIILPQ
jgi:hypothetical protein